MAGTTADWTPLRRRTTATTVLCYSACNSWPQSANVNVNGILMPEGIRATAVVVMATTLPGNDAISSSKWNLRGERYIQSKILSYMLSSRFVLAGRFILAIVGRSFCAMQ